MGRSYEMKEGRKAIIPTKKQAEAMVRKQAEANANKDEFGNTGMANTVADIPDREAYVKTLKLSKKEQAEILEAGRATDQFIDLNVLRILKAMRDGTLKNEMEDPNFKFSLDKLIKKWSTSEVELMAGFDKNNQFLGYQTQGRTGVVAFSVALGQLVGGTSIHSHPSEGGRFFGGTFSDKDWKGFRDSGAKAMIVTSLEGVYILQKTGQAKYTNTEINTAYVRTAVRTVMSKQRIKDDKVTKFGCSKSDLAVWRDRHNGAIELGKSVGIQYTFIPNKGFEGLDK